MRLLMPLVLAAIVASCSPPEAQAEARAVTATEVTATAPSIRLVGDVSHEGEWVSLDGLGARLELWPLRTSSMAAIKARADVDEDTLVEIEAILRDAGIRMIMVSENEPDSDADIEIQASC